MQNRFSPRKVSPEEAAILNDPKWLDELDRTDEDLMAEIAEAFPDWAAKLGCVEDDS